jgi:hypothetical protein
MLDTQQRLSVKEKFAYGLGDAAANFVFQTQLTFLMFFYTNVFGIAAGTAGTILLFSRIVDAFNDPIVGALADRTNTRWGRYRPWVLWTAAPMAIVLVLCYTTPSLNQTGKIIWAIATYNLLMIIYAANNIPYSALSGVMTSNAHERTSLVSWRFVCAMAAALAVNVLTVDLIRFFGGGGIRISVDHGTLGHARRCILCDYIRNHERASPSHTQAALDRAAGCIGSVPKRILGCLIHARRVYPPPTCAAQRHLIVLLQLLLGAGGHFRLDRQFRHFQWHRLGMYDHRHHLVKAASQAIRKGNDISSLSATIGCFDGGIRAVAA